MDIKKIKKGLECCLTLDSPCGDCPYYSYEDIQELDCERNLRHDVISLLKEQEKAKVVFGRCKDGSFATECGYCGTYLDKAYSICPKCNKELDWNSNQD